MNDALRAEEGALFEQLQKAFGAELDLSLVDKNEQTSEQTASDIITAFERLILNPDYMIDARTAVFWGMLISALHHLMWVAKAGQSYTLHAQIEAMRPILPDDQYFARQTIALSPDFADQLPDLGRQWLEHDYLIIVIPVTLGHFSRHHWLTPSSEAFRDMLCTLPKFATHDIKANLPMLPLTFFTYPWMEVTYYPNLAHARKMKRYFNLLIKHAHREMGCQVPEIKVPERSRPKIAIVAEHFHDRHVMFRTYGNVVKYMASSDECDAVLVTDAFTKSSTEIQEMFGENILEVNEDDIQYNLNMMAECAPDAILYLSLGMKFWAVQLCQYRLAKLQGMLLGHPDSSQSQEIDIVMGQPSLVNMESEVFATHYTETFVTGIPPKFCFPWMPPRRDIIPTPNIRPDTQNGIHIAINANGTKINAPYLELCKQLNERADRPLHFHFLPNLKGLDLLSFKKGILTHLPDANIYPKMPIEQYFDTLNTCDIALGSIPFNGSNSIIDNGLVGLPTVSLIKDLPHERSELVSHLITQTEHLCTDTLDAFVDIALELIADDEKRVGLSTTLSEQIFKQFVEGDDKGPFEVVLALLEADVLPDTRMILAREARINRHIFKNNILY